MALQTALIEIPLAGGLAEKISDRLIPPGQLLTAQNTLIDKLGQIKKRNGFIESTIEITEAGEQLTNQAGLTILCDDSGSNYVTGHRYKTGGPTAPDGGGYLWADGAGSKWTPAGRLEPMELIRLTQAGPADLDVASVSSVICGKYRAIVWEQGSVAYVSIFNLTTESVIVSGQPLCDSGGPYQQPKVIAVGDSFHVYGSNDGSNELGLTVIDTTAPTSVPLMTVVTYDLNSRAWDACATTHPTHGPCSAIAYEDTAGNNIWIRWHEEAGGYRAAVNLGRTPSTCTSIRELALPILGSSKICLAWYEVGANPGTWFSLLDLDGAVYLAATKLNYNAGPPAAGHSNNIVFEIAQEISSSALDVIAFGFSRAPESTATERRETLIQFADTAGSVFSTTAAAMQIDDITILGSAGTRNGRFSFVLAHHRNGSDQSAVEICSFEGPDAWPVTADTWAPVFEMGLCHGEAQNLALESTAPKPTERDSNTTEIPILVRRSTNLWAPAFAVIDHAIDAMPRTKADGRHLVAAGAVNLIDGRAQDLGFQQYPEILGIAATYTTGGEIGDGTRFYKAVFEWTDAKGATYQSAPSDIQTSTLSAGTATQRSSIRVNSLHFGESEKLEKTKIVLYRTEDAGTVYYRAGEGVNDPVARYVTISDSISDADLITGPTLYTTGGVLPAWPIPPARDILADGDRIAMIPADNPRRVVFSMPRAGDQPFVINPLLYVETPDNGDNEALGSMDGHRFVFKRRAIYRISGTGPNAMGIGVFSTPALVTQAAGCINKRSICHTDAGIVFLSERGIELLTRSHQLTPGPFGAAVEDSTNGRTLTRALFDRDSDRLLIAWSGGMITCFDFAAGAWSTWRGLYCEDAAIDADGDLTRLTSNPYIQKESGTFLDDGAAIQATVETPWINPAGIQGYVRTRWIHIQGEIRSDHTMTIGISYDYDDTIAETITHAITGSAGDPLNLRIKPSRQKCSAIKLKIQDADQAGGMESFRLDQVALVIAGKGRLRPLGNSNTAGN